MNARTQSGTAQAVAVADGQSTTAHAAATLAVETLAAFVKSLDAQAVKSTAAAFDVDGATPAAVRLAHRAAREAAGLNAKSKGGARADVLAVLALVPADTLPTAPVLVAAAVNRMRAEAQRVADRRAEKKRLAEQATDAQSTAAARTAANETLAGMQAQDDAAAANALATRVLATLTAAKNGKVSAYEMAFMIRETFGARAAREIAREIVAQATPAK